MSRLVVLLFTCCFLCLSQGYIPGANKTSSTSDCKTEKSQYLCGNQRCIALNAVCDKKDDCGDGSDEGAGCTSSNCTSAKCDHECKQTPKGSVCTCKPGYKLQNNNRTCKDIDECQIYGICDQECINSPGSYKCQCQEDYYLFSDKKTCKARAGKATLTFSTSTSVKGMYVDSKIIFTLATNLNRAVAVTTNNDITYWSDMEENSETIVKEVRQIFHASHREVIVTTGLSRISGIAVDWITENIYFTDEGYNRIGVCTNDTNCTVLISGLDKPTGITLLPTRGKMYWSDGDSNARIAVAGMDGKNIRTFVSERLSWPRSPTIDYLNDRLYWVDSKLNIVDSIRLDGTDRRIVQRDIIQEPYALAVFENTLYWSDWGSNTIQSCNKFSGKDWRILHRTQNKPYGIHIDHSAIKPKIDNPCKSNPCSQLCMLNQDKGYTCACTLDKELNADNHTCRDRKKKQHLLIVTNRAVINYYHEWLGKPKVTNVSNLQYVLDVISDPLSGQVLIYKHTWLKYSLASDVMRYDPVSNTFENITRLHGYGRIDFYFSFDYIGNNLYMLNIRNKSIEVYNIKTLAMTAFYFQDTPFFIALAPEESKMFVLFQKFKNWFDNNDYSIYEMRMDGLGERKLLRKNLEIPDIPMYYDRDSRTLFVSDSKAGSILSYSNNEWHVFRTGLKMLTSLTVAGDNIFWTKMKSRALYWTSFKRASNHEAVAFHIPDGLSMPLVATLRKDAKQEHDCQKNNGNCSHVCLPSSITSFICACPLGMELSLNDSRTCILDHECPNKDEYKCSEHNVCIKKEQLCDGIVHCPNGEDETIDCKEKGKRCKEDQFMCKNGECINSKGRCNSHFDCADQSDEENCEKPKCRENEFQCCDGTCIQDFKACNGVFDCGDYSDEQFNYCKSRTCAPDGFMCNEGNCIPYSFVCDGQPDCMDALDEAHCKPQYSVVNSRFIHHMNKRTIVQPKYKKLRSVIIISCTVLTVLFCFLLYFAYYYTLYLYSYRLSEICQYSAILGLPKLETVAEALQKEMAQEFQELTVDIATCPDLTSEPFNLAGKGLNGATAIIELGNCNDFLRDPSVDVPWDIRDVLLSSDFNKVFIIGSGYSAMPHMPNNGHLVMNAAYKSKTITNASRVVFFESNNGQREINLLTGPDEMKCSLMGNFFISRGNRGKVLRVRAKGRKTNIDIITMIQGILHKNFPELIGLGGVLRITKGRVAQHVMAQYPRQTQISYEDLCESFRYDNMDVNGDLIAVGTVLNKEPVFFPTLRRNNYIIPFKHHHFHSFSTNYEAGGQFVNDIEKDKTEYEGYFNLAVELYTSRLP